ncbi:MAG: hydrolase 2, exosortase A system-associated [Steroidobacteraceae bacterium]
MTDGLRAEFIGAAGRRLFVLLRTPGIATGECTLVVPPFAEEMNKSRRIVTDLARRMCSEGRGLLCVDLAGTGDSEGEFGAARVARWLEDIAAAMAWSASQGWRVTALVGIRLGALLGAAAVRRNGLALSSMVFWQPATSGSRLIEQFLRIRVMASRMEQGRGETAVELRARMTAGETIEVAGYPLSAELCADIEALNLHDELTGSLPPIRWLEVVGDAAAPVAPGTLRALERARAAGCRIDHAQVTGDPFWMATEIVTNPALVAAT